MSGRPCDRTISFGIGGIPVANEPDGAGYFVSQGDRNEPTEPMYDYIWTGWQAQARALPWAGG